MLIEVQLTMSVIRYFSVLFYVDKDRTQHMENVVVLSRIDEEVIVALR